MTVGRIRIALGAAVLAILAAHGLARAQLSAVDQIGSTVTPQGGDVNGFRGFSTSIPVPNNGTTFRARYAFICNADTTVFSTRDTTAAATHQVNFDATATGGYRLDVQTQRVGDMNRVNDASGCDGSADVSSVAGSSNVAVASGTLSLSDPGAIGNGQGTTNIPFNQSSDAVIYGVSNGMAQSHALTFTWSAAVRSNSCEAAVRMGKENGSTSNCTGCEYPGNPSRTQSSDGHFVTVTLTSLCGNGAIETFVGEQCDDGNTASGDCCSSACQDEGPGCNTTTTATIASTTTTSTTIEPTTSTSVTTTTMSPSTVPTTTLPTCAPAPIAGCNAAITAKSGVIIIDDDDVRDAFKWKWKGAATAFDDFKDPTDGTPAMAVCVYDGTPAILLEAALLPGGTCAESPCWKRLGKVVSPTGHKYKNKLATPHGLTDVKLKAGEAGKATIDIKGRGLNLQMPALGDVVLPVSVQLVVVDGMGTECWEAAFGTATRNDSRLFKAKGP